MNISPPATLGRDHDVTSFDCGEPELDDWLKRYAMLAQSTGSARVFVTTQENSSIVIGFYALVAAQLLPQDATVRAMKGQSTNRALPAVLLARLAVDRAHQAEGIGRSLLQDVMIRTAAAADLIGARALIVHAKNERARAWYLRNGFEESPTDPLHLMLLIKEVRRLSQQRGGRGSPG